MITRQQSRLLDAIVVQVPPVLDRLFIPIAMKLGERGACTTMSRMLAEVLSEFDIHAEVASVYVETANKAYYDYRSGEIDLEEAKRRGARIQKWGDIKEGQKYQHAVCYIPAWDAVVDLAMQPRLSKLVPCHPYWAVRGERETFPWWVATFELRLYYLEYRAYETQPDRVKRGKQAIREVVRKYLPMRQEQPNSGIDKVLRVETHTTPYTSVPEKTSDFYRLKKVRYTRGLYRMEGVMGYDYFQVVKPIIVTDLQFRNAPGKRWQPLMVDDPLHWLGMGELASKCSGKVLVGGLGMGLVLHWLLKNKAVTSITVVEIDPELTAFIKPYLPVDPRIEIIHADYLSWVGTTDRRFDCAIIDLWVLGGETPKEERQRVGVSMQVAEMLTKRIAPNVYTWGVRGYSIIRHEDGEEKEYGACYEDAWRFIIKEEEGYLIHGTVWNKDKRIGHAWVETETGYIWEPETKRFYTKLGFKDIAAPIEEQRYTPVQAAIMVARTGNFGAWTESERGRYLKMKQSEDQLYVDYTNELLVDHLLLSEDHFLKYADKPDEQCRSCLYWHGRKLKAYTSMECPKFEGANVAVCNEVHSFASRFASGDFLENLDKETALAMAKEARELRYKIAAPEEQPSLEHARILCEQAQGMMITGGEEVPPEFRYLIPFIDEPLPEYSLGEIELMVVEPAVGERKIDAVLRQLKSGVESIQGSEQFRQFLVAMSRFHDYSIGNQILIAIQKPEATKVAGFMTWRDLERWVKKGEKGIAILAPCLPTKILSCPICGEPFTERELRTHLTEVHNIKDVSPLIREARESVLAPTPTAFKVVYVFDISQTEGEPLPEFEVPVLTGEVNEELFDKLLDLSRRRGVSVSFESRPELSPDIKGQYIPPNQVWVRPEEARAQQLKSLTHEIAHYYSEGVFSIPRRDAEVIAESAAFVIGAHYGFDTGVRSFPYVARWAEDKKVLEENLEAIRRTATAILEGIKPEVEIPSALLGLEAPAKLLTRLTPLDEAITEARGIIDRKGMAEVADIEAIAIRTGIPYTTLVDQAIDFETKPIDDTYRLVTPSGKEMGTVISKEEYEADPDFANKLERGVLKVSAKLPKWCLEEKAWGQTREGQTCYNPYAVVRASIKAAVGLPIEKPYVTLALLAYDEEVVS